MMLSSKCHHHLASALVSPARVLAKPRFRPPALGVIIRRHTVSFFAVPHLKNSPPHCFFP
jgi:hypothetical protein